MNTPYFWLDGLVVQSSANTDKAIFRTLQESLALAKQKLQGFANEPKFTENMAVAFGKGSKFDTLKTRWSNGDFSAFPAIKIRSAKEINGANGAFGANKIYLSLEFLASHQVDIWAITGVILEELGHWVDTQVNTVDSDGDEGAIFAALVQGSLSAQELQLLKAEDDRAVVILDGQSIAIEQQNFTGTAGDDTIVGTSGDDVIDGLEGNDSLSGLEGNDTINSGLGTDTVNGGDGDDLLIVDYSSNTYSVWPGYNISTSITDNGAGSYNGYYASPYGYTTGYVYDVVYFSNIERFNITGTIVDDYITTGNGNDLIDGRGGIDNIIAGGGADKIILADAIKQYYDDLNTTTSGTDDYANIIGFETHDIIQLAGSPTLYRLNVVSGNTELYLDKPGSEPDELIGIVQGVTNLSLTSDNFIYVQPVNLNEAPTAVNLNNQITAIAENSSTTTRIKVADIAITDDALGTNNLSVSGTDASFFEIDGNALYLKANTALNFEAKTSYSVSVNVDDSTVGSAIDATTNFTLTVTNVNEAPTALILSDISINENVAINSTVGTFSNTDPDTSDAFTYSLVTGTGSTNNSSFTIVNNELRLRISPNFETKASYLVRVRSTDAGGLFTESPFTITINNLTNNAITGTIANETFTATNELDTIDGGGGNDNITATVVNLQSGESFDGNTGVDTFTLSQGNLTDVVTLDLSLPNQLISLTGVSGVTLSNFENINIAGYKGKGAIAGSNVANVLTGGVSDDSINGGDGNDIINGGAGNDILIGGAGNDILIGGAGADSLTGGTGNDVYYIDNVGDTITELSGEGADTVVSTLDYNLVGTNLENLTLQGTAINGTGNEFNNSITGNASDNILIGGAGNDSLNGGAGNDTLTGDDGNDSLNGGTGADSMTGGTGNDVYYIDNVGDTIIELTGEGTDTVVSTLDYNLVGTNLENLTLQGTAINGTGNEFNNSITGNASDNFLIGGAGNDSLTGNGGSDILVGGTGNDTLNLGLNDGVSDLVRYALGDGTDTINQFVKGTDLLAFTGTNLFVDVKVSGSSTQLRLGDGIQSNANFGTGTLLATITGVTGFTATELGLSGTSLAPSNTATFLFA